MGKIVLKRSVKIAILLAAFAALCILCSYYFIILALVCLAYGLIEPYLVEIKETYFIDDKIPETFENFKIVFVSDIHHSRTYSKNRVKALVNKINLHKPDLILLGGDYVDRKTYIKPLFQELKKLKAKNGVYGVLGNHDHAVGAKAVKEAMKEAGILCLDNKAVWLNKDVDRIRIGGVGDFLNDIQDIKRTIDVVKKEFVILVAHNPDYAEEIKNNKIDLVLSGHNHGGQVTVFGLWAPFIISQYGQKYRTGLVNLSFTKVLVSNGVGNVGGYIPVRFFARPQINIIYLKKGMKNR